MQAQSINYHTYMLRIWNEPQFGSIPGDVQWRFALNDTVSGKQWGFVSLEDLNQFLESVFPTFEENAINVHSTY